MAVEEVIIQDGLTGESDRDKLRKYGVVFKVKCSSPADTPETVLDYLERQTVYPSPGRTYSIGNSRDRSVHCKGLTVTQIKKSGGHFLVNAQFDPNVIEINYKQPDINGNPTSNPLEWRDEIELSTTTISVPVESGTFRGYFPAGVTGNKIGMDSFGPIINSATQVLDPPLERDVKIRVLRITKHVPSLLPFTTQSYIGAVNNNFVFINKSRYNFIYGWDRYQGKIIDFSGAFGVANGIKHFRVTLEVHINPLGWRRYVLDQGTEEVFTAEERMDGVTVSNSDVGPNGFIKRRVVDPRGTPIKGLLNGNGKLLKNGQNPVFLIWQVDPEISFAGIAW